MKLNYRFVGIIVYILLFAITTSGQAPDSAKKKLQYPNTVKLNLTSMIEFSPSVVVAYERLVKPSQSFSVMGGFVTFPISLRDLPDSINLVESKSRSGYRIGGEYRFYFKKENRYEAPHGLYWGPYLDYFHFKNERIISIEDTTFAHGDLDFSGIVGFAQVGVNIGYQFVIKKRFTIDMTMFGPGVAYYRAKLKLDGNFDVDQENAYLEALYDFLLNNFPFIGDLTEDREVDSKGRADLFFAGFRYSICAGFRFEAQKAKLVRIALTHIGEVTELIVIAGQRNRKVVYRLHEG
jgi:hypothetical protein